MGDLMGHVCIDEGLGSYMYTRAVDNEDEHSKLINEVYTVNRGIPTTFIDLLKMVVKLDIGYKIESTTIQYIQNVPEFIKWIDEDIYGSNYGTRTALKYSIPNYMLGENHKDSIDCMLFSSTRDSEDKLRKYILELISHESDCKCIIQCHSTDTKYI